LSPMALTIAKLSIFLAHTIGTLSTVSFFAPAYYKRSKSVLVGYYFCNSHLFLETLFGHVNAQQCSCEVLIVKQLSPVESLVYMPISRANFVSVVHYARLHVPPTNRLSHHVQSTLVGFGIFHSGNVSSFLWVLNLF